MRFRRRNEEESPAWPGLVDVFAFTLVFVLILWGPSLGTEPRPKSLEDRVAELEKRVRELTRPPNPPGEDVIALKKVLLQLTEANTALSDEVARLALRLAANDAHNADLEERLAALEGRLNAAGDAFAERIRLYSLTQLRKVRDRLAGEIEPLDFRMSMNEDIPELMIEGAESHEISFPTARYELSATDQERLRALAPLLIAAFGDAPFEIRISGRADPRGYHQPLAPRHNVDLSALRAATVSTLMESAKPGIGKMISVMGLGEEGQKVEGTAKDQETGYRAYRRVSFHVRVPLAFALKALRGESSGENPKP